MITHITIDRHDARYDHQAEQAVLPVTAHRDGRTEPTRLVIQPGQVELYMIQLEQIIYARRNEWKQDREATGTVRLTDLTHNE